MNRFKLILVIYIGLLSVCSAQNIAKNDTNENLSNYSDSVIMKINNGTAAQQIGKTKVGGNGNIPTEKIHHEMSLDLSFIENVLNKLKNENCIRDTKIVLDGIANKEKWAYQMFDASPKYPEGILYGSYYQLGNFDECLDAKQGNINGPNPPIQGQYCLADIEKIKYGENEKERVARSHNNNDRNKRSEFNKTIHWAICIPSSCSHEDAKAFVSEIYMNAVKAEIVNIKIDSNKCHYTKNIPFTAMEIVYGSIVGVFLAFIILATVFHYWNIQQRKKCIAYNVESVRSKQGLTIQIVLCFSLIQTIGKFLQTKPNDLNLECICGIKLLSMCFIILGHSLIFLAGGPVLNTNFFAESLTKFVNGIFTNSPLLVDTFLLLSGFLMCRLLLVELDRRKGKINFLILYIARYIRLTPSYLVVIGLYCTLLYRVGEGPFWDYRIGMERDRCMQSWWANILYINNYVNTDHLCMFQSWYLAVDYHLFIVAPFIIYPLWKWSKAGEILLGVLTGCFVVVPFMITYLFRYDPTLMVYAPEITDISKNNYFKSVYIKTHMRASSYFIGIFFGYLIHKIQKSGIKISKTVIYIGWITAAICGILSMFSIIVFYQPDHEYNALESAVYASLHRVAWCISIGWILIVCITDNATYVNKFLSWKFFIPLSRLTYCAYLINGLVEIYSIGVQRESTYMSTYELSTIILSHLLITFACAFVICILFESPIHGLEKILLRKAHQTNNIRKPNTTILRRVEDNN